MIVETRSRLTANYHALSYIIIDCHQKSFALNMFKIVMIVDDTFSRLTARMIVDDSLDGNELAHYHHAPFDQGFSKLKVCRLNFSVSTERGQVKRQVMEKDNKETEPSITKLYELDPVSRDQIPICTKRHSCILQPAKKKKSGEIQNYFQSYTLYSQATTVQRPFCQCYFI